jgi:hypothetical protein
MAATVERAFGENERQHVGGEFGVCRGAIYRSATAIIVIVVAAACTLF